MLAVDLPLRVDLQGAGRQAKTEKPFPSQENRFSLLPCHDSAAKLFCSQRMGHLETDSLLEFNPIGVVRCSLRDPMTSFCVPASLKEDLRARW